MLRDRQHGPVIELNRISVKKSSQKAPPTANAAAGATSGTSAGPSGTGTDVNQYFNKWLSKCIYWVRKLYYCHIEFGKLNSLVKGMKTIAYRFFLANNIFHFIFIFTFIVSTIVVEVTAKVLQKCVMNYKPIMEVFLVS